MPTQGQVPAGKSELFSHMFRYSWPRRNPGPKVAVFVAVSTLKLVRLVTSITNEPLGAAYPVDAQTVSKRL